MGKIEENKGESGAAGDESSRDNKIFPNVFFTVGTTSYDDLVNLALSPLTVSQFKKWETKEVKIQIGKSLKHVPETFSNQGISFELYRYKESLDEDYAWADLVISHAGAGTVLDVLDLGKPLFVIPNEGLMDNHQIELGNFIQEHNYGFCSTLLHAHRHMATITKSGIAKFPEKNATGFVNGIIKLFEDYNDDNRRYISFLRGREFHSRQEPKPLFHFYKFIIIGVLIILIIDFYFFRPYRPSQSPKPRTSLYF